MIDEIKIKGRSGLELIGGFDNYQNILYQEVKRAMLAMDHEKVICGNICLYAEGEWVDGLEYGLCGYFINPRPLTEHNLHCLEEPLDLYLMDAIEDKIRIPPEDRGYWEKEAKNWIPVSGVAIENKVIKNKSISNIAVNAEFAVLLAIKSESDKIIKERKQIKLLSSR